MIRVSYVAAAALLSFLLAVSSAQAQDANYFNADKTRQPAGTAMTAPAPQPQQATPDASGDDADAVDGGDPDEQAQQEVQIMPAHSAVVTSIDTCLNQLDADDAAAVRSNYTNPYQDCQQRLGNKTAAKKTARAGKRKNGPEAENARNFVRIKPPKADDDAAPDTAKDDSADDGTKVQGGSWSSSVKPDKSKAKLNP